MVDLETILRGKLSALINSKIKNLPIDDQHISVKSIPDLFAGVSNYNLSLTGGKIVSSIVSIAKFDEQGINSFYVEANGSLSINYSSWSENYTIHTASSMWPIHSNHNLSNFSFSLKLNVIFNLLINDKNTNLTNLTAVASNINFNIPDGSTLKGHILSCVDDQINNRVQSAIEDFNFTDQIQKAIKDFLNP